MNECIAFLASHTLFAVAHQKREREKKEEREKAKNKKERGKRKEGMFSVFPQLEKRRVSNNKSKEERGKRKEKQRFVVVLCYAISTKVASSARPHALVP